MCAERAVWRRVAQSVPCGMPCAFFSPARFVLANTVWVHSELRLLVPPVELVAIRFMYTFQCSTRPHRNVEPRTTMDLAFLLPPKISILAWGGGQESQLELPILAPPPSCLAVLKESLREWKGNPLPSTIP